MNKEIIVIIEGKSFVPIKINRVVINIDEVPIYSREGKKCFTTGNIACEPIVIVGDAELEKALKANSGGSMTIKYPEYDMELTRCFVRQDSNFDRHTIKLTYDSALAQ